MGKSLLLILLCSCFYFSQASDTAYSSQVHFRSGSYILNGQLLLPQRTARVPAIVFLVGSGEASYRTHYRTMLEEAFEKQFLPQGVALLYFDKRGIGGSQGKWYESDFYERADDAKAAIDFLKTLPEIDASRIGVVGHSQGGWIAQIVAARYPKDVAFMVSLAGPTFSVRDQLTNDFESQFRCKGMPAARAHRKAGVKAAAVLGITSLLPINPAWRQLKEIRSFTPRHEIKTLSCPSFFLFAENDALVYPQKSIDRLNRIFGNKILAHMEVKTIAGANHGFHLTEFCYAGAWKARPLSPEFLSTLKDWVLRQVNRQPLQARANSSITQ